MRIKIDIVDAFTDKLFCGNPAAVIITEKWLEEDVMQSIAMENNLSETAFLIQTGAHSYQIRWFSPLTEVNFCGHATLASAYVIFRDMPGVKDINISAKSVGNMGITRTNDGYIHMDFPNRMPSSTTQIPAALLEGLSQHPREVLINEQAYFAIFDDENDIHTIQYDPEKLKELAPRDVVVTSRSVEYDFISRYFWPANGGNEDPVTGSIHTGLAPYWSKKLKKTKLIAHQASSRGGTIFCNVNENRVILSGKAVHYLEGYINL